MKKKKLWQEPSHFLSVGNTLQLVQTVLKEKIWSAWRAMWLQSINSFEEVKNNPTAQQVLPNMTIQKVFEQQYGPGGNG